MGKNIVHCGPSGTGQVAKVCNNLVLGISMVAVMHCILCGFFVFVYFLLCFSLLLGLFAVSSISTFV